MGHPVGRLLMLLELLQAYRRLSAGELARRLEVTPRTVRRYVSALYELGIPVEAELGRHGGYRLRPGYRLPPLMLTDDEALAVVLGLLASRRVGLVPGSPAIEGALAKLDRVLPDALRQRIQAAQDTLAIGLGPGLEAQARFDAGAMLALGAAAHDCKQVRIEYRAYSGKTTQRTIDPYGVVFQSGHWYLAGWDHLRHAPRTFRMDRLLHVEVTDRSFMRSADFDAVTEVQRAIATAPWAWSIDAVLELPIEEARRRVSPTLGTLERHPDGVRLRFGADSPDWAVRYLIGLNTRFKILEPPELRATISRLAAELLADHELRP